jgi:enoyl-CoA hydratase/carnithine racemase
MHPSPPAIVIPESYTTLPTKHITVSHYPASSPTATPVIVVTLNRPQARNAFTIQMMEDFELIYPIFDVDERVKCIVLTGNPAGKAFCAGADLDIGFNAASGVDGASKPRIQDSRDT